MDEKERRVMDYVKTHTNKKAFENHLSKLKARGANITTKGMTIKYSFESKKAVKKLQKPGK